MIEKTAAGPQFVLSGAAPAGDRETAQRRANAPLRGSKAQQPCDRGMFSDDAAQADLLHLIGRD